MVDDYKGRINQLVQEMNRIYGIDPEIEVTGRPPTQASSNFLTNKEQGDWAEEIVFKAINEYSPDYVAIKCGRSESLSSGDPGFPEFYIDYQNELNTIGKKPDLLIFNKLDIDPTDIDLNDEETVKQAIAAIEVRSSSFLANKYAEYMDDRTKTAIRECQIIRNEILKPEMAELLESKSPEIMKMLREATPNTFFELDFRRSSWSSSAGLKQLSELLKSLKEQIKILHKRDYLSITPKLEDIALVNRWVQQFNVPHFYLQVFFDKAYVIPFKDILGIATNPDKEGSVFTVEGDVKNQNKTTIKINVQVGKEIIGKIDMPEHKSEMKELERGRLLFYVTFRGGHGYLDHDIFMSEIVENE